MLWIGVNIFKDVEAIVIINKTVITYLYHRIRLVPSTTS